jgi:hypothetical protein
VLDRGLTLELHAYQSYVFLDWRELRPTAQHPWDRLCDSLNGRGVRNLDDELVNLELRPVHDALRRQLEPAVVRLFADLAEHPRAWVVGTDKSAERARAEFFEQAWTRCESFVRVAQSAYVSRLPEENKPKPSLDEHPTDPTLLAQAFRQRMRAAMRIPALEAMFPEPWTAAARRVLPSPSPQFTATAMWGPVLAWCALELLAESIDAANPERVALDLFDRLRLREPFALAFNALGFEGEEGWRVAARIKVELLAGAGVGKETAPASEEVASEKVASEEAASEKVASEEVTIDQVESEAVLGEAGLDTEPATVAAATDQKVALAPALWRDPDVRWLTGVHEAEGHLYLVREQYEELLWWLLMPSLLRLASESAPSRDAIAELSQTVDEALATAEASGYRIDTLPGTDRGETSEESEATAAAVELGIVDANGEPDSEPVKERAEIPEDQTPEQ